jgi:tripartite-type tricarboxylate transporter receptor subunit TctC
MNTLPRITLVLTALAAASFQPACAADQVLEFKLVTRNLDVKMHEAKNVEGQSVDVGNGTAMKSKLHAASAFWRLAAALLITLAQPSVHAQAFPTQPLHIIVNSPAGSILDTHARRIGDKLAAAVGQPVVIDNRPGASGLIAAELAAKAKPDGHTLLLTDNGVLTINPAVFAKLPYDPLRSFAPVSGLVRATPLLLVHPQLPVRTLPELIAYAKARPGRLSYGSPGVGSPQHLAMEQLKEMHGLFMVHIPYKGASDALTDLIGGRTEVGVNFATIVMPHVQSGRVRAIAVAGGSARKPWLPDVPTAAELGMQAFDGTGWSGFVVPAGTPPDVIERLNREIAAAAQSKDYVDWLTQLGAELITGTAAEFGRYIEVELVRWAKVARHAGVPID